MADIGGFDPESFVGIDRGPGDEDRVRACAAIVSLDSGWHEPTEALDLGEARWKTDLIASEKRVLHLALSGDIPRAILKRMAAAHQAGYEVTAALGSQSVDIRILSFLQELDARIVFVEWEEDDAARGFRSVADWIATDRISLSPTDLQLLASTRLTEALDLEDSGKGRLFEEVLCLMFSQVSWFTVDEHAYRNDSEEIDLVLGVHAVGHIAELLKGAVAIATAKNEKKATGSSTVKYLKEQMANRKGRCKLGFLCSASSISREAHTEMLRGSQSTDFLLVPVDLEDIRKLLDRSARLDDGLRTLILSAVNS
jgi:hypothetical protein